MINYVVGDITEPQAAHFGSNGVIVAHLCNDQGVMGSGAALHVKKKWPGAFQAYMSNFRDAKRRGDNFNSDVSFYVEGKIVVANMVAMDGYGSFHDHVNYEALKECIDIIYDTADLFELNVVMPKIGSLRAHGNWEKIEEMILVRASVPTYIYLYEEKK